jgi:membrane protein YdbS with pleckstrin-like domain
MSFTNPDVDLAALPRFDEARLHALHPRYPRLVLGLVGLIEVPAFLVLAVVVSLLDRIVVPARFAIALGVLALFATVAWFAHRTASAIRYAVRRHDVIVRSGVFWQKVAVQPIKRIQHVQEMQGPLEKFFGLSTLKLFSAGTGHVTLQIPGLDVATAAALSRFILGFHEPGADAPVPAAAAHAGGSGTAVGAATPSSPADGGPPKPAADGAPPSAAADAVGEGPRPGAERSEP